MSGVRWNEGELHVLQNLWSQGFSASEIATEIPSKSREAICGKLFRLRASGMPTRIPKRLVRLKRTRGGIKAGATRRQTAGELPSWPVGSERPPRAVRTRARA
jgi:GcrA cell cycle regulator